MVKSKKYFLFILSILCVCVLASVLVGCASLKGKITGSGQTGGKPAGTVVLANRSITKKQTKRVGEPFDAMSLRNKNDKYVLWECTVQKAKLYSKPSEAGIDTNKLIQCDYYKNPDDPKTIPTSVSADSMMLLCDIEIKNIADDQPNVTELTLVSKNSKGDAEIVAFPNYFSQPENPKTKYYSLNLAKGSTKTVQVGWYINLNDFKKESLYLAMGYDTGMEDGSSVATYVKLDL